MFGWLKDVGDWIEDTISSIFKPSGGSALKTKVNVNGKSYTVYKMEDGKYYYNNGSKFVEIKNSSLTNAFKNNENKTYDINYTNGPRKQETKTETKPTVENVITNPTSQYNAKQQQQAKQQEQNRNDITYGGKDPVQAIVEATPPKTTSTKTTSTKNTSNSNSNSNANYDAALNRITEQYNKDIAERDAKLEEYEKRIEELENPKILSAQEVANILGIDYNEANILKEYNKATNEYYDSAIDELQGIRTDYDKNNTQYLDQIMDSYLESSKYTAPTASGKGTRAANVLSTLISAAQSNALGDYDILQDINANNEARKKDLANNPKLAKQQYNDLGTTLSGLSANFDQAKTKAAINKLDAYTQHYAADTSYRSQLANQQAAKYSGLANAAATGATSAANKFNSTWDNYYNYYKAAYGSGKSAANAIKEMLTASQGS